MSEKIDQLRGGGGEKDGIFKGREDKNGNIKLYGENIE
jgi:hypothetical protein